MTTRHHANPFRPYFYGVAMALIVGGAGIFATALVESVFNVFADAGFGDVMLKAIGGLIVLALGYIQIELELLRMTGAHGTK